MIAGPVRIPFKLPFLPKEKVSRDRPGPYSGCVPDQKNTFSFPFLWQGKRHFQHYCITKITSQMQNTGPKSNTQS